MTLTRRGFFGLLAALPFVGRFVPKAAPVTSDATYVGPPFRLTESHIHINGCSWHRNFETRMETEIHGPNCQCGESFAARYLRNG